MGVGFWSGTFMARVTGGAARAAAGGEDLCHFRSTFVVSFPFGKWGGAGVRRGVRAVEREGIN